MRHVAADIAPAMLERTRRNAERRGVADVVELVEADVAALPFADGGFDLTVSFTGLHCFPDPRRALHELGRVTAPGGALTGSAFLNDAGLRHLPMRVGGRALGLLGPGLTRAELAAWLPAAGFTAPELERSGGLTYFRARRAT